ncbi:hypothetical protein [Pelagibacterium xiamenense]|uniref:hypothetical protein n=1 Tax=Pelagibacterium xiamenense TaxID=2901140 RepID=UPI001E4F7DE7|nr:hypothetical protein [Pelagibacterium xiamenense]MCD7058890.1 hypothetical protein [Pelagibacterium xiamenense]
MSAKTSSLVQEAFSAADGCWRLAIGRREAPSYFSDDLSGLVSSFIGLIVSVAIALIVTAITVPSASGVTSFSFFFSDVLLYGILTGASWVVLRFLDKADRFVAYLTVSNWLSTFFGIAFQILALVGLPGEAILLIALVAGLATYINNARLVVGLRAAGIAMLMVGQVVGVMIGLLVAGAILGPALQS